MKKLVALFMVLVVASTAVVFSGCTKSTEDLMENAKVNLPKDKYNTYYQIWIGSFCDSNNDGIGDIQGIISKLDYINDGDDSTDTDLGYTGIWLSPMMPSPSYHKYDVKDYYNIDPQFGTLDDFDRLIKECDKRGIDVIIDFVPNHCSSEHPWFKKLLKKLKKATLTVTQSTLTLRNLLKLNQVITVTLMIAVLSMKATLLTQCLNGTTTMKVQRKKWLRLQNSGLIEV